MALTPQLQLAGAWTAVDNRLAVHVFEGHLTLSDMDRLQTFGDDWTRDNPGKRAELVIVYPSDSRMTSEERTRMGGLIKRWEQDRIGSATVILAQGMLGAMQRSVLTGLQFIAPPKHPQKVFGTVPDAITWLVPFVREVNGPTVNEVNLRLSIETLCRDFQARRRT